MTQQLGTGHAVDGGADGSTIVVEWASETNEEGGPTRWLGSWLVSGDAVEGAWFYGGYGGERTTHAVPAGATGIRVRKWLSEGLDPEYIDVGLNGETVVQTGALDFDAPQPHRVFRP